MSDQNREWGFRTRTLHGGVYLAFAVTLAGCTSNDSQDATQNTGAVVTASVSAANLPSVPVPVGDFRYTKSEHDFDLLFLRGLSEATAVEWAELNGFTSRVAERGEPFELDLNYSRLTILVDENGLVLEARQG